MCSATSVTAGSLKDTGLRNLPLNEFTQDQVGVGS